MMKIIKYTNYNKSINNILLYSNIVVFKPDPIEFINTVEIKYYLSLLLCNYIPNYDVCTIIADHLINNTPPILISILVQLKLFKYSAFLTYILSNDFDVYNFLNILSDKIAINIVVFKPQQYPWYYGQNNFDIDVFNNTPIMYQNTFLIFSDITHIGYHYMYYEHIRWLFLCDNPIINTHDNLNDQNYMIDINSMTLSDNNFTFENTDILIHTFICTFIANTNYDRILTLIYTCIHFERIFVILYNNKYCCIGKVSYNRNIQIYEFSDDGFIKYTDKIPYSYIKGNLLELI